MVIEKRLSNEVDKKMLKLSGEPDYFLKRAQRIKRALRHASHAYSFWIEHPDMRLEMVGEKRNSVRMGELKKRARIGAERLREAWNYLESIGMRGNFIDEVTPELIVRVSQIIDPDANKAGLRHDGHTTLQFRRYVPPNSVKVLELVENFCYNLKESDLTPLELGAYAHLYLTGIQPVREGNKRLARLFQDRIYDDYGLPPTVIPAGEREVYHDVLEQALLGISCGDYSMQRPFYDFIGGKVNVSLDEILGDLKIRI